MAGTVAQTLRNETVVPSLNAAELPKGSITASGAANLQLEVGKVYRFQAIGAAVYFGFGVDGTTANTNSATSAGVFLDANLSVTRWISSANVAFLGRTPVSGTTELRVFEVETR